MYYNKYVYYFYLVLFQLEIYNFFTGLVTTPVGPLPLRCIGSPPPSHLEPTIYRSDTGANLDQQLTVGTGANSLDMLTVAIKIQVDENLLNLKVFYYFKINIFLIIFLT